MSCGFAATARGRDIERAAKAHESPESTNAQGAQSSTRPKHFANDLALFFPEGLLAGAVLLASPFWAANLAFKGAYAAATALMLCAGLGVGVAVYAWRQENKWLLYAAVLVVLVGAWAAS